MTVQYLSIVRASGKQWMLLAALSATLAACGPATTPSVASAEKPAADWPVALAAVPATDEYELLHPGVYTDRERALVEKYIADNAALKARGPINAKALVSGTLPAGTPGLGPVIKVTEAWVRYTNGKYDWENPLRLDADYARKAGYQDILAYPTFGAHDDTFMVPYPPATRDALLVSDLNHNVTIYKPIYPGDTLYLVANERNMIDLTPPEGSMYRSVAIETHGSVYNQKAEKVNDVIFRVTESIRVRKDGPKAGASFMDIWEAPNWMARSAHTYTDADWTFIKKTWSEERQQGATPLYWKDVKVGDRPQPTLEGPIEASVSPVAPWGMGSGGGRTIKKEILDPAMADALVRDQADGIWRLKDRASQVPPPPPGGEMPAPPAVAEAAPDGAINTQEIHKDTETRSPLINYMGRDFAIRHLGNWMGEHGRLVNIRWSIMDPRSHRDGGKIAPVSPFAEHWLSRVPGMEDRYVNVHGLTKDVALVKSYVASKYVKDGEFLVDVIWWIETIEGDIFEEGMATVVLPNQSS